MNQTSIPANAAVATVGCYRVVKFRRDNGVPCSDLLENVSVDKAIRWATKDPEVYRDPVVHLCNWQGYRAGPDIDLNA